MAHIQQQEFCRSVRNKFPDFFQHKMVLDIGSLDVNGNNHIYFQNCNYIGIDLAVGRNVDIVSKGHELNLPDQTFDVVISTECFEHDQFYQETIKNIYRLLKPGGLFIFTCATTGRPEHGTRRTRPEDAPLLPDDSEWSDYYKNLAEEDIREFLDVEKLFSNFEFSTNEIVHDLYFFGVKQGEYVERNDYSFLLSENEKHQPLLTTKMLINRPEQSKPESIFPIEIEEKNNRVLFTLPSEDINSCDIVLTDNSYIIDANSIEVEVGTKSLAVLQLLNKDESIFINGGRYYFPKGVAALTINSDVLGAVEKGEKITISVKFQYVGQDAVREIVKHFHEQFQFASKEKEKALVEREQILIEKEDAVNQHKALFDEINVIKSGRAWKLVSFIKSLKFF